MKYLVLLVVLVVAYGLWRSRRGGAAQPAQAAPRQIAPQDILACAHCGVHVPQAEALVLDSRAYCCPEHQRLGPA